MNTFLPYPDFHKSAQCLDNKRLGKQRVEALQILKALYIPNYGWQNHPAVKMWRGYGASLVRYGIIICIEWKWVRGFEDTCFWKIWGIQWRFFDPTKTVIPPPWLGDPAFHSAHRAALLFKDPEWYGQFGWEEEPKIEYVWPTF